MKKENRNVIFPQNTTQSLVILIPEMKTGFNFNRNL